MEFYIDHPEKMDIHATKKFQGIHATKKFHGIHATKKSKIFNFFKNSKIFKICRFYIKNKTKGLKLHRETIPTTPS
jgi:hypothetical protein